MVFAGITTSGLLDEIIPDVDTEYEKIYTIPISENSGFTDPELVDISSSSEYEDFKDNIDGFEITDISMEVVAFDGPSDMYFSGEVLARDTAMETEVIVGDFMSANLSELVANDSVYMVSKLITGLDQVEVWLEDPGMFYALASYNLTDKEGNPYPLNDAEYNLKLGLKYMVTVITVASSEEEE